MPFDVRKRSALQFNSHNDSGLRPDNLGISPRSRWSTSRKAKGFRTSDGTAADFLGKALIAITLH